MNLLLCYYCFGRAAHARCLSHSAYPAPLRHGGRVNKPLTHEPRRIDNTPRHAASPFRDPFLSRRSIFFPLSSPPSLPRDFIHGENDVYRTASSSSLCLSYLSREERREIFSRRVSFAYDLFVYICTYIRLGSGARFERNTISMERGGAEERRAEDNIDEKRGRGRDIDARGSRLHLGISSTSSLVEFTLDIRMRAACTHTCTHP